MTIALSTTGMFKEPQPTVLSHKAVSPEHKQAGAPRSRRGLCPSLAFQRGAQGRRLSVTPQPARLPGEN